MKKIFLFALTSVLLFPSCVKEEKTSTTTSTCDKLGANDYLIFGTHYGLCAGNCAHLFKLTSTAFFEDNMDRFLKDKPIEFKTTALDAAKLDIAKSVCSAFPDALNNEKAETMGCPNCVDQGAIYIELSKGGVVKKWNIDPDKNASGVPDYVKAYTKTISDAVESLRK